MQQPLLKLSQASELTGRHEDTIRRIIKNLLRSDPQAKEKIKQEQTVRGFHYLIDKEYLLQHVQPLQDSGQTKNGVTDKIASDQPSHQPLNKGIHQPLQQGRQQGLHQPTHAELKAKDETIAILKKQLEMKDEQIRQFLERTRETNILLKGYQDKYILEAPKEKREEAGKDKAGETTAPEKSKQQPKASKPKRKHPRNASGQFKKIEREQPRKKSFWSSLWRK